MVSAARALQDLSDEDDDDDATINPFLDGEDSDDEDDGLGAGPGIAERLDVRWSTLDDEEVEEIAERISSVESAESSNAERIGSLAGLDFSDLKSGVSDPSDLLGILDGLDGGEHPWGGGDGGGVGRHALSRISSFKHKDRRSKKKRPSLYEAAIHAKQSGSPLVLRKHLSASHEDFDPQDYLAKLHAGTGRDGLQRGLENLQKQLAEGNTARMALVKDNFERFIKCKNTIDDVRLKLQQNELDRSAEAANTELLREALCAAREEALAVFQPLIERQRKAERLRSFCDAFRKHRWFFEMPHDMLEMTREHDSERVISSYRKARAFMASGTSHPPLFAKVFAEIDKVIAGYKKELYAILEDSSLGFPKASVLIRTLTHLEKESGGGAAGGDAAPSAQIAAGDPFLIYLHRVEADAVRGIESAFEAFRVGLEAGRVWKGRGRALSLEGAILNILTSKAAPLELEYPMPTTDEARFKVRAGQALKKLIASCERTLVDAFRDAACMLREEGKLREQRKRRASASEGGIEAEAVRRTLAKTLGTWTDGVRVLVSEHDAIMHGLWLFTDQIKSHVSDVLEAMTRDALPGQDAVRELKTWVEKHALRQVCRELPEACKHLGHFPEGVLFIKDLLRAGMARGATAAECATKCAEVCAQGAQGILSCNALEEFFTGMNLKRPVLSTCKTELIRKHVESKLVDLRAGAGPGRGDWVLDFFNAQLCEWREVEEVVKKLVARFFESLAHELSPLDRAYLSRALGRFTPYGCNFPIDDQNKLDAWLESTRLHWMSFQ